MRKDGKNGIIILIGNVHSEVIYEYIDELRYETESGKPDLTKVSNDDFVDLLDGLGDELVPLEFEIMDLEFKNNVILVRKKGLYGYLDRFGNYAIEPIFEEAFAFNDGVALVKMNGLYGYIDPCGNYLLEPCFVTKARTFKEFLGVIRNRKTII